MEGTNTTGNILKGCAFYGSNASEKTSALNAISILFDLLFLNYNTTGIAPQITLYNQEPIAYFEYVFLIDNSEIKYYFEIDRSGVIKSEKLYIDNEVKLDRIGRNVRSNITENKDYDDIDDYLLFLRIAYFNTRFANNKILKKLFEFLTKSVYLCLESTGLGPGSIGFEKEFVYDTKTNLNIINYLLIKGVNEINEFLSTFNFPYTISFQKIGMNPLAVNEYKFEFCRKNLSPIQFDMESYGNKKLMRYLPYILFAMKNNSMLMIDEFSSGLHNELEELLIKYVFHKSSCQLFFVSHSTNLLKTSLLRPDRVYCVNFDKNGCCLKRFSDENPRESQNPEKMYLSGVFGGIPIYDKSTLK